MKYQPYKYPPDMELARLHSQCTKPGDIYQNGLVCPCCGNQQKIIVNNWLNRNIGQDYSKYGGAVITYLSLIKFYAFAILSIILIYSIYQIKTIFYACQQSLSTGLTIVEHNLCVYTYKVWIISTQDLIEVLKQEDGNKLAVLMLLRGISYVLLIVFNFYSLYIVERDRRKIKQQQKGMQNYSIILKNINKQWRQQDIVQQIKKIDESIQVKEIFFLKQIDKIKRWYDVKIQTYFALQNQKKQRNIKKYQKKLFTAVEKLEKYLPSLNSNINRVVITFNTIEQKEKILKHYETNNIEKMKFLLTTYQDKMYANQMYRPDEVFWNYLGQQSKKLYKIKFYTIIAIGGSLTSTYFLLRNGLILANHQDQMNIPTSQKLFSLFLSLFLVAVSLGFRQIMNFLAEIRRPNSQTEKTVFIVTTTILYHFLFYLIIPTIYFVQSSQYQKSLKLFSISFQSLGFLLVQIIFIFSDMFYLCWQSGYKKIMKNEGLGMCQKQVHEKVQSPRFPIQFKLIVLFKMWSLVIFYAFEVPYVLIIIFIIYLMFMFLDKKYLYNHYRVEIISSDVQFTFLKVYINFFTIYLCIIFCLTQKLTFEIYIAVTMALVSLVFQTVYSIREPLEISQKVRKVKFNDLKVQKTYKQLYEQYLKTLTNIQVDQEIQDYYNKEKGITESFLVNKQQQEAIKAKLIN